MSNPTTMPKTQSRAELALKALEHILRHSQTELGANTIRLELERLKRLDAANELDPAG